MWLYSIFLCLILFQSAFPIFLCLFAFRLRTKALVCVISEATKEVNRGARRKEQMLSYFILKCLNVSLPCIPVLFMILYFVSAIFLLFNRRSPTMWNDGEWCFNCHKITKVVLLPQSYYNNIEGVCNLNIFLIYEATPS